MRVVVHSYDDVFEEERLARRSLASSQCGSTCKVRHYGMAVWAWLLTQKIDEGTRYSIQFKAIVVWAFAELQNA